jgi:2-dehydro-3-deoxygluconokinase
VVRHHVRVHTPSTSSEVEGDVVDVVTIGETMVAFVSHDDPRRFTAVLAGAESNVAMGMARLGCRARWVSRLGADPLGDLVESSIAADGVDVAVVRDVTRPTGVMTKHVSGSGTRSRYYRTGSAASALSAADLDRVGPARWLHVTGITAAISDSAAGLVGAVVARRTGHRGGVSFDVNHRPALWPDAATAAGALLPLARNADVVFIGDDEADVLFGTADQAALATLVLRHDRQELVLKRGVSGAAVITAYGTVTESALPAEVVDVTGAGDAFAAGYLAGRLRGWAARDRLRLGHLMGSRVVAVLEDVPPPFPPAALAGLSPEGLAERWDTRATE